MGRQFPRTHRLHFPWEYRRFFSGADAYRLGECVVFRIPNTFGHPRLGITLKVRCRSVDRNRMKRQLRQAFRERGSELGAYDYNVVVTKVRNVAPPFPAKLGNALRQRLPRP